MRLVLGASAILAALAAAPGLAQDGEASFFITSQNPGSGGDLGGLEGADAHCAGLAEAAGLPAKTWRAYLSTSSENARDRIGTGPWYNVDGVMIAESVEALHGEGNNVTKETALDETGAVVSGSGDDVTRHDILTGSMPDGTAAAETCGDWTDGGTETAGMVGHHDRRGRGDTPASMSWNSSHPSRGGCGLEALRGTGGDGLLYCFAAD
jgi:hypothetical protein